MTRKKYSQDEPVDEENQILLPDEQPEVLPDETKTSGEVEADSSEYSEADQGQEDQHEDEEAPEEKALSDYGYTTPDNTPIHNVEKAIVSPYEPIQGDPDPANPTLSNPSLLPQTPILTEQQMIDAAPDEEDEEAPYIPVGQTVSYVTKNGIERPATVHQLGDNGQISLHAFLDPSDQDFADHGSLGQYHGVPFSSKNRPHSWHLPE